jgi:hypothetical protein
MACKALVGLPLVDVSRYPCPLLAYPTFEGDK